MLNLDQLKAAINNGDFESVYRDCRRYGIIVSAVDHHWPRDLVTVVTIQHKGLTFQFSLQLGRVTSATFY